MRDPLLPDGEATILYASRSRKERGTIFPSTQAQLLRLEQDAAVHRETVVARFAEEDFSGSSLRGPLLKQALAMLKDGRATVLKVTRMNRLVRSLAKLWDLVSQIESWGARIDVLEGNWDFKSARGRFTVNVLGAVDQLVSDEASELFALKAKQRVVDMQLHNGTPPYGYRVGDDGRLVVNEAAAAEVLQLATWLEETGSVTAVLDLAADAGMRRPSQSPRKRQDAGAEFQAAAAVLWTRWSLVYVLTNPVYTGQLTYKGKLYPGRHEALITAERHARLCELVQQTKGNAGKGDRRNAHSYLLSTRLWYAHAGDKGPRYDKYMGCPATKLRPDGTPYLYYRRYSATKRHYADGTRPKGERLPFGQIPEDLLENYVLSQLRSYALDAAAWTARESRVATACNERLADVLHRLAAVEAELDSMKERRQHIRERLMRPLPPAVASELDDMLTELNEAESNQQVLKLDLLMLHDAYRRIPLEVAEAKVKFARLIDAWDRGQRRVVQSLLRDVLQDPHGVVIWGDRVQINLRTGAAIESLSSRCVEIEVNRARQGSNLRQPA